MPTAVLLSAFIPSDAGSWPSINEPVKLEPPDLASLRPSRLVAPLVIVVQLSVPLPFVERTCPFVPLLAGNNKT
jgi:hypothetical protein